MKARLPVTNLGYSRRIQISALVAVCSALVLLLDDGQDTLYERSIGLNNVGVAQAIGVINHKQAVPSASRELRHSMQRRPVTGIVAEPTALVLSIVVEGKLELVFQGASYLSKRLLMASVLGPRAHRSANLGP